MTEDGTGIDSFQIYDSDNRFQVYNFAKYLNQKYGFITFEDNDVLYCYEDGCYRPNGKAKVREEYLKAAENGFTKRTMNKIIEVLKGMTTMKRQDFGEPPHLINMENGVYDLKEDELLPHGPDMMFLSKIPVTYQPDKDCPKIKEFVHDIVNDSDVDLVQELFGYCLYRDYTLNKAFMFLGEGSNGKSTLLNLIERFLGEENVAGESLHDLLHDDYAKARLFGKFVNVDADISNDVLSETKNFKKLTGRDTISAHRKYEKAFKFKNYAKLAFSANKLPRTREDSLGFFRRWILIDFPYRFTSDSEDGYKDKREDILDDIASPDELSGLFNWAVAGLKRLLENDGFSTDGNADAVKKRWIEKADTLAAFIDQYIEVEQGAKMPTQKFFERYSEFCQERDVTPHDHATVGKRLQKLVPKARKRRIRVDGDRVNYYFNIVLKDELDVGQELLSFIDEMDDGDGVYKVDLLDKAEELGWSENDFVRWLEERCDDGAIFEPKPGRYKVL